MKFNLNLFLIKILEDNYENSKKFERDSSQENKILLYLQSVAYLEMSYWCLLSLTRCGKYNFFGQKE